MKVSVAGIRSDAAAASSTRFTARARRSPASWRSRSTLSSPASRIGSALSMPRSNTSASHTGVWRATGWEIVQHFLAQQPKKSGDCSIDPPSRHGIFSVHTWGAVKTDRSAPLYSLRGPGVLVSPNGAPAVRIDRMGPENYWFGARPHISLERRGPGVDAMIEQVRLAVANYPLS